MEQPKIQTTILFGQRHQREAATRAASHQLSFATRHPRLSSLTTRRMGCGFDLFIQAFLSFSPIPDDERRSIHTRFTPLTTIARLPSPGDGQVNKTEGMLPISFDTRRNFSRLRRDCSRAFSRWNYLCEFSNRFEINSKILTRDGISSFFKSVPFKGEKSMIEYRIWRYNFNEWLSSSNSASSNLEYPARWRYWWVH